MTDRRSRGVVRGGGGGEGEIVDPEGRAQGIGAGSKLDGLAGDQSLHQQGCSPS